MQWIDVPSTMTKLSGKFFLERSGPLQSSFISLVSPCHQSSYIFAVETLREDPLVVFLPSFRKNI